MVAIPKKHVKNILDCDMETLHHLMVTVKKITNHCVDQCNYDGVNLLNASDESAGQSVPHFHIHMIPRRRDDGIDAWPEFAGADCEIEEIYQKIKFGRKIAIFSGRGCHFFSMYRRGMLRCTKMTEITA